MQTQPPADAVDPSAEFDPETDADRATTPRDEAWFEALFAAHAETIVRFLARRGAYDEAEDLAAEVFATAWRRRQAVPDEAELPWLYRTATWTLNNWFRKSKALPMGDNQEFLDEPDTFDPAKLVLEDDQMRRALESLSARDREILLLAAWEGLIGQELADYLGVSRSGADAALSRARSRLEAALQEFS